MIREFIESRKKIKAFEILKEMSDAGTRFLYMTDKLESPFTKVIDGKRYVYAVMSSIWLDTKELKISASIWYRSNGFVKCEYMASCDPSEFLRKVKPIFVEEFEFKTSHLFDEIVEELKTSKWVKIDSRVYEIDKWYFDSQLPSNHSRWKNQDIHLEIKALDIKKTLYFPTPETFGDMVTLVPDSKSFEESEVEYLEKKSKEFEGLRIGDVRYCESNPGNYKDITKAVVVNTYKYGDNDMYVEYEVHHMSDDTNKVETFVSEFNKFRTKYSKNEI